MKLFNGAGRKAAAMSAIAALAFPLAATVAGAPTALANPTTGTEAGATGVSQQTIDDLRFTLEEERMARDLYTALGERWPDARPFQNIPWSEQQHMNMVVAQMDRLGIPHDVDNTVPGVFENAEIQNLYNGWLARGLTSKREAFTVGKELEERDIDDITAVLDRTTDPELRSMYERLRQGSYNHLDAFNRQLSGGGGGGGGWGGGPGGGGGWGGGWGDGPGGGGGGYRGGRG